MCVRFISSFPTSSLADMQHISDYVLSVLGGLVPGHLNGGWRKDFCTDARRHTWQPVSPQHCQTSTGLCGASTVLGNTLIYGLIILGYAIDGQSTRRKEERENFNLRVKIKSQKAGMHIMLVPYERSTYIKISVNTAYLIVLHCNNKCDFNSKRWLTGSFFTIYGA